MKRLGPQVVRTTSKTAGGCNFCDGHMTPQGENSHTVFDVSPRDGGGVHVRFCTQCLAMLFTQIELVNP